MTKWKPAKKVPMLGNGPRFMLGQVQALPILVRWGLPWLLTAGGIALTSAVLSKAIPDIPINKQKIGLAAALGGGGFTAYLLSSTVPEDWKPLTYAAAVAGIAASAYFLFSPPAKTDADRITPTAEIKPGETIPKYTPGPMLQNFVVQTDPRQAQTNGAWRQPFGNQIFDVLVSNNSDQPFTFFTGAKVYGNNQVLMYTSPTSAPTYGRTKTTVAPGAQEVVKVTIPKPSDWSGPANPGNDNALQFEFFRQQADPTPFKISDPIPIYYTFASGLESILGLNSVIEVHDEMNPDHVIGCKKCKRKKKRTPFSLPQGNIVYNR